MDWEPAFLSDELFLEESERIAAANLLRTCGKPSKDSLLQAIEKQGQIDGLLESAVLLTLDDYREVEAAWLAAPVPAKPKIRRRKS